MTYPARCAGCGAIATDTLWSDPSVPIYACGTNARQTCQVVIGGDPGMPGLRIAPDGLDTLTRGDRMDLLLVVDLATGAALRRP